MNSHLYGCELLFGFETRVTNLRFINNISNFLLASIIKDLNLEKNL
jgi:hypothetical protein